MRPRSPPLGSVAPRWRSCSVPWTTSETGDYVRGAGLAPRRRRGGVAGGLALAVARPGPPLGPGVVAPRELDVAEDGVDAEADDVDGVADLELLGVVGASGCICAGASRSVFRYYSARALRPPEARGLSLFLVAARGSPPRSRALRELRTGRFSRR